MTKLIMGTVFLLLLLLQGEAIFIPKVTAQLYLVSYEPTVSFRLTFSEPVELPIFQILMNNNNLTYAITT